VKAAEQKANEFAARKSRQPSLTKPRRYATEFLRASSAQADGFFWLRIHSPFIASRCTSF